MRRILFALFIILSVSSCLKPVDKSEQAELNTPTSNMQHSGEDTFEQHREYLNNQIYEHGQRIDDLYVRVNYFLVMITILTCCAIYYLNRRAKVLEENYKKDRKELEGKHKLLDEKIEQSDDKLEHLDLSIKLAERDLDIFRKKVDNTVEDAVMKLDNLLDDAIRKLKTETDKSELITEEIKKRLEESKLIADNLHTSQDWTSTLIREIDRSKGILNPQLRQQIKEQIEDTKRSKSRDEFTAIDWFLEGANAFDSFNFKDACLYYEKAVEEDPNYADAYNNWGVALKKLEEYSQAICKYRKALEIKPNDAEAYNNWGVALKNLEKHAEAIDKYKAALEIRPEFINPYHNWTIALDKLSTLDPIIYPIKKQEFEDILQQNKDLPKLIESVKFQEIYKTCNHIKTYQE